MASPETFFTETHLIEGLLAVLGYLLMRFFASVDKNTDAMNTLNTTMATMTEGMKALNAKVDAIIEYTHENFGDHAADIEALRGREHAIMQFVATIKLKLEAAKVVAFDPNKVWALPEWTGAHSRRKRSD